MSRTERRGTLRDLGPFAVDVSAIPGETVLALHGELDIFTQPLFAKALAGVDESAPRIVLDLSDLTFIDCANIGLIHRARIAAGLRGTYLELRSPTPHVSRIFELTGLLPAASSDQVQHRSALPVPSRAYERVSLEWSSSGSRTA